ncbi:hypothetical protein HPB47_025477 [Ixodes persulcatus]|uniref:Uncharacterized protein n=1 Tax=Ixodes persulcatus TaxID=34615 RepID=A0AC60Q3N0_IXOPE|nr:hypothetical protein HPB47_025477 [Ixodes persulcatus]
MLKNKPGIQTMASVCFTFHSMFLTAHLFAVVSADDVSMYLKLNSIDTSVQDVRLVAITRMIMMCVTIVVSLFLVIGIEDAVFSAILITAAVRHDSSHYPSVRRDIDCYEPKSSAHAVLVSNPRAALDCCQGLIGKQVYSYWRLKSNSDSADQAFTGGLGQESTKTAQQGSPRASNGSSDIKDSTATTAEESAPAGPTSVTDAP